MTLWNTFDAITLAALAVCVMVWPTQLISDNQNRWLRIAAVSLIAIQLIVDGARIQLLPAYLVTLVFAVLLVPRRHQNLEPSKIRESKESLAKKLARWTMVLGTAFILLVSIVLCLVFPRYEYPKPSGQYALGVHNIRLTDPLRPEADTSDPNDHRELLIRVSYPASFTTIADERDRVPDPITIAAHYAVMLLVSNSGLANSIPTSWGRVATNAWVDAPLSMDRSRFPVLIYSHGLGSWPEQNTALIEELASHGYVVLAINHAGLSAGMTLSDGSVIDLRQFVARARAAGQSGVNTTALTQRSREIDEELNNPTLASDVRARLIKERASLRPQSEEVAAAAHRLAADDQRFVLDQLNTLQASDRLLANRLDLDRVGVFGMSTGGTASHLTCATDKRCLAGINMDGFQPLLLDAPPLKVPFMHMSNAKHFNHIIGYEQSTGTSYLVRVGGTAHGSFTDIVYSTPMFRQFDKHGIDIIGTIDGQRMLKLMNEYVLAFFDKHLLGQNQPLLNGPSERYPEVTFLSK